MAFDKFFNHGKGIREILVSSVTAVSVGIIIYQLVYNPTKLIELEVYIFDSIVTAILIIDFYLRMKESKESKRIFILKHLYEIPALIPLVVFGVFESYSFLNVVFRLLRLIRLFRIIHLYSRILSFSAQTNNRLLYIIAVSGMAVSGGAIGLFLVEGNVPESKVTNLGDAFWWAIVTVTTVGYGDIYPVTTEGKIIASVLMIFGIAILGILISTLGASFIESRLKPKVTIEEESKKAINEKICKLELLDKDEYSSLILSINTLYNYLIKRQGEKINNDTSNCLKCNNSYPKDSRFCNRCGYSLLNN
jgi:voltage-gated potassium channel